MRLLHFAAFALRSPARSSYLECGLVVTSTIRLVLASMARAACADIVVFIVEARGNDDDH